MSASNIDNTPSFTGLKLTCTVLKWKIVIGYRILIVLSLMQDVIHRFNTRIDSISLHL